MKNTKNLRVDKYTFQQTYRTTIISRNHNHGHDLGIKNTFGFDMGTTTMMDVLECVNIPPKGFHYCSVKGGLKK